MLQVIALLAVCKYWDLHALCIAGTYKSTGHWLVY